MKNNPIRDTKNGYIYLAPKGKGGLSPHGKLVIRKDKTGKIVAKQDLKTDPGYNVNRKYRIGMKGIRKRNVYSEYNSQYLLADFATDNQTKPNKYQINKKKISKLDIGLNATLGSLGAASTGLGIADILTKDHNNIKVLRKNRIIGTAGGAALGAGLGALQSYRSQKQTNG